MEERIHIGNKNKAREEIALGGAIDGAPRGREARGRRAIDPMIPNTAMSLMTCGCLWMCACGRPDGGLGRTRQGKWATMGECIIE